MVSTLLTSLTLASRHLKTNTITSFNQSFTTTDATNIKMSPKNTDPGPSSSKSSGAFSYDKKYAVKFLEKLGEFVESDEFIAHMDGNGPKAKHFFDFAIAKIVYDRNSRGQDRIAEKVRALRKAWNERHKAALDFCRAEDKAAGDPTGARFLTLNEDRLALTLKSGDEEDEAGSEVEEEDSGGAVGLGAAPEDEEERPDKKRRRTE